MRQIHRDRDGKRLFQYHERPTKRADDYDCDNEDDHDIDRQVVCWFIMYLVGELTISYDPKKARSSDKVSHLSMCQTRKKC